MDDERKQRNKELHRQYMNENMDKNMETYTRWKDENPRKMLSFRVTPAAADQIMDYLNSKANEEFKALQQLSEDDQENYKRRYTSGGKVSLNTWITRLLEDEMGTELMPLPNANKRKAGRKPKSE